MDLIILIPFFIFFVVVGCLSLFKPELFWKSTEKWKSEGENLRPSKKYITFLRVCGGIYLAFAAAALVFGIGYLIINILS